MAIELFKNLKLLKKIKETEDTYSFAFDIPADLKPQFHYKAGQFVTLQFRINNEEVRRSYSLCTSPFTDSDFKITVKRVPNGKMSNFLIDKVNVGDIVPSTPPAGLFFKPVSDLQPRHYVLFGAGSGITPLYSILKTVIATNDKNFVTLVYCNRNQSSVIFDAELKTMLQKNASQLEVVSCMSRPEGHWTGLTGRLNSTHIKESVLPKLRANKLNKEFYLCGPVDFMDLIKHEMLAAGYDNHSIHIESFFTVADDHTEKTHTPPTASYANKIVFGKPPLDISEKPQKIIATVNGEHVEVDAVEGQSILETLLNQGISAPYSCMDGACMACLGKLKEGSAYQDDFGVLTEDNVDAGEMLTCQAKPISKIVKVNYDEL